MDYFTRERGGIVDWQRNGKFLKEKGYYTTLIADDAVKLIDQQDGKTPFFLYFASLAPHAPYQVPQKYKDLYPGIKDKNRQAYAGMISALDEDVGRIVAALEKKKLLENTIILFASDNGGATSALFATGARSEEERKESGGVGLGEKPPASNAPFRGGKGSLYEGGVRVPAFVSWPGHLQPRVVNEPLHMVDVMPTLLALSGAVGSPDHPMDGKDMWPTLAQGRPSPTDDVLINVEAFRGAIRKGNWKLVKIALLPGKTELFDLATDPSETTNVAEQHPDVVSRPRGSLDGLRQTAEAKPVDQGPARVRRRPGENHSRSGLRHRRWRSAARKAGRTRRLSRVRDPMTASVGWVEQRRNPSSSRVGNYVRTS